jgi:hypothetical protein
MLNEMRKTKFQVTIVEDVECRCGYNEYENYVIAEFATVQDAIHFASKTIGTVEIDAYELDDYKQWSRPDSHENLGFIDGELQYHEGGTLCKKSKAKKQD